MFAAPAMPSTGPCFRCGRRPAMRTPWRGVAVQGRVVRIAGEFGRAPPFARVPAGLPDLRGGEQAEFLR
eukprot:11198529-Lingulodinium_polyedra.AAC.1